MKFRIWNEEVKCYVHEMGCNQHTRSSFYVGQDGNVIEVIVAYCEPGDWNPNGPSANISYDTQFFDFKAQKFKSKYRIERKLENEDLYEGDIVSAFTADGFESVGVLVYYPTYEAIMIHLTDGTHFSLMEATNLKKVGNIHRNPNLLK